MATNVGSRKITMALVEGPLTNPLIGGDIAVGGNVDWSIVAGTSVDQNSRKMLNGDFDVAEMSFATYVKARELGQDLIGLPIFTGRGYLQPGVVVSSKSGVTKPEELAGKRVLLPQFWMTSSVWHRGILAQQHHVPASAVTWLTTSEERFEGVTFPAGVSVTRLDGIDKMEQAITEDKADAYMTPPRGAPKNMDGPLRSPYGNLVEAQKAYFKATGVFPIMHFVLMRESLHKEMPDLAGRLMAAFVEAKNRANKAGALPSLAGETWEFGLAANKAALDTFFGFVHDQGWVAKTINAQTCFVSG
jgi:4,5-dihydroxyphthalate decarboxylase